MNLVRTSIKLAFLLILLTAGCQIKPKTQKTNPQTSMMVAETNPDPENNEVIFELTKGKKIAVQETHPMGQSLSNLTLETKGVKHTSSQTLKDIDPVKIMEMADLDQNGVNELYILTRCVGSGSYGNMIVYTLNREDNLINIEMPQIKDHEKIKGGIFEGYMGHDLFSVKENKVIRSFPIYIQNDSNSNPTGDHKEITYILNKNKLEILSHRVIATTK